MKLQICKKIYDKEAILAAAYSLSGLSNIKIHEENNDTIEISLEPKEKGKEVDFENQFWNELIDHQVRFNLETRFGRIRELIVKHAFTPLDNLKAEVKNIVGRD